jgi:hypothetical protein
MWRGRVGKATATAARTTSAAPTPTPTSTPTVDRVADTRVAKQAVIALADFPASWTEPDRSAPSKVKCPAFRAARAQASGRAISPRFSHGEDTEADGAVYVFADEPAAQRAFAALSGKATRRCYGAQAAQALVSTGRLTVGEVGTARLSMDPLGDEQATSRLTLPVTGQGTHAEIYVDLVVVRVSRGVSAGLFIDTYSPFDEDLSRDLTAKQVRRLAHGLS